MIGGTAMIFPSRWMPPSAAVHRAVFHHGSWRSGQLRCAVVGVSEKMLVQQLREMESDGLVHREVHREVPPGSTTP